MHRLPRATTRLLLREFKPEDAPVFAAYHSEPAIARYQRWSAPYQLLSAVEFIEQTKALVPGTIEQWYPLAIRHRTTNDLLGDCAFRLCADVYQESAPPQAEIGCTLALFAQGQGYAREAIQELIAYLSTEFSVQRIFGTTAASNLSSQRLLERLGFTRIAERLADTCFNGSGEREYVYAYSQVQVTPRKRRHFFSRAR